MQSLTFIACAGLLCATGCDWRSFDDLSDEAWAQSAGSPGDLNAGEFATNVGFSGSSSGVAFLSSGQRPDGVASIAYDTAGSLTSAGETILAGSTNADALPAHPAMAGDANLTVDNAVGRVAVGLSQNDFNAGAVAIYDPTGPELMMYVPIGTGLVTGLAFGVTNKPTNPTATDLVATTADRVSILRDYDGTPTTVGCGFARERGFSAAVADVHTTMDGAEIILAVGNDSMSGAASKVLFLDGLTVEAGGADITDSSCVANGRTAIGELTAPGGEGDFGAALVVADFDGGGGLDIAVGAPSTNKVYVYMNVDFSGGAPGAPIVIDGPTGAGRFGLSLAAGDFDNDGNDELVVGDPGATVDGTSNAGRAHLIPSDGGFGTMFTLGDPSPEADQSFGRGLAVGNFDGGGAVLAVAARNELFTYFRTPLSADVRQR